MGKGSHTAGVEEAWETRSEGSGSQAGRHQAVWAQWGLDSTGGGGEAEEGSAGPDRVPDATAAL